MNIIEGLIAALVQNGYQWAKVNVGGLELLYRTAEERMRLIVLFHAPSGYELSEDEYSILMKGLRERFLLDGLKTVDMVSLVFTRAPKRAKKYVIEDGEHWLIDLNERRLLLFENYTEQFQELKDKVEEILSNEEFTTEIIAMNMAPKATNTPTKKVKKPRVWFTLLNTSLVVVNIIIYLIVHHTDLFGGRMELLDLGAVSWQTVFQQGQYYRLLSSLFLHGDFSHLFNNMLILLFVGDNLERIVGKSKYLIIYLGSGLLASLASVGYNMWFHNTISSIGASGAIFGVVGAVLYIIILNRGRIEDISGGQMFMFIILSLYGGITSANTDNAAHFGGLLAGIILASLLYRKREKS